MEQGKIEKEVNKEFKVVGVSKVSIPSPFHPIIPYYVLMLEDKNGNILEFSWGTNGLTNILIHYEDSATKEITFEYNTDGFCNKVNLPDGRYATFVYDGVNGNLITSTDMAGYQTCLGMRKNYSRAA